MFELCLEVALVLAAFLFATPFVINALALYGICFTFVREGTAIFIMAGEKFDHVIMAWTNHYLNDPRRPIPQYNPEIPDWEVLRVGGNYNNDTRFPNLSEMPTRRRLSLLRLLERYGIYFYGLWPFKDIHEYKFKWTEEKTNAEGKRVPWHREEWTHIIYVHSFLYWVMLEGAEDSENAPIKLTYLLTTEVNNPYKARFTVTNWLERLIADSHNAAKVWVSRSTFKQIVRERSEVTSSESTFVIEQQKLNTNLPTEHAEKGAPEVLGVRLRASSLQQIELDGEGARELTEATTATLIAQQRADALRATAEGDRDAAVTRAEGQRQAIELVYTEVQKYGQLGVVLSQLDAMKATGPGDKIIWANNPFVGNTGLAAELQQLGLTPQMLADGFRRLAQPATPPTTPT